jgi:hypothetical protein
MLRRISRVPLPLFAGWDFGFAESSLRFRTNLPVNVTVPTTLT